MTCGAKSTKSCRRCDQFPEIATAFYEAAIQRTTDAMAGWLRRQCERGLIKLDDPQVVAGMLRGMMIMERSAPSCSDNGLRLITTK